MASPPSAARPLSKQLNRSLFFRIPYFAPLSVVHSLAIIHKIGSEADKIVRRNDRLDVSAAEKGRGVVGFHLQREPHSLKPKRYGTIVLSDAPLASSLSDMYFGEQHIPLPTVPGQPPRAKFTSPTKVQLAGIKDVAPLVGLRLSDSPKLWYNQTENQQEDMDDDDPGNQSGEDTSVEPWFELRLGRKELPSVSAKRTGAESKRLAADKAAFAKFKGFRHLVER